MSSVYKNSPLQEAICEINFTSNNWDLTYPGDFYSKIKEDFPNKQTQSLGFLLPINDVEQGQRFILQCFDNIKSKYVQIADNFLSINFLRPYSGWIDFKGVILNCLDNYRNVANPNSIRNIRLRYINKIDIGNQHSYNEIKKLFQVLPIIPEKLGDANSLQMIVEIPYNNGEEILAIQQATLREEKNMKSPLLFEISYFLFKSENFNLDYFDSWIENAHNKIEEVFNLSFTSDAKNKFN